MERVRFRDAQGNEHQGMVVGTNGENLEIAVCTPVIFEARRSDVRAVDDPGELRTPKATHT